jgi:hypothetical protein
MIKKHDAPAPLSERRESFGAHFVLLCSSRAMMTKFFGEYFIVAFNTEILITLVARQLFHKNVLGSYCDSQSTRAIIFCAPF